MVCFLAPRLRKCWLVLGASATSVLGAALRAGDGPGGDCPDKTTQKTVARTQAAPATATPRADVVSAEKSRSAAPLKLRFPRLEAATTLAADRTLDTRLTWERSVQDAAEKAAREGKLVYVIHVSGDFEKPEFT